MMYSIFHWDTFDNETLKISEQPTIEAAERWVEEHYGKRIRPDGADKVDIVDKQGNIVRQWSVG